MKLRILTHEKRTDQIRIGSEFSIPAKTPKRQIRAEVLELFRKQRQVGVNCDNQLCDYWSRVSVVNADTLATVLDIYNEHR